MRVSHSLRQFLGPSRNLDGALSGSATAARRGPRCLKSQCARYAIGLARSQRQQQMPALEVGAPDEVNRTQARRNSPTCVYADKIGLGNLALVTLGKIETTQTNFQAPQEQRNQGALWARGKLETYGREHGTNQLQTFLDVTPHQ
jgi:hypothetical protein